MMRSPRLTTIFLQYLAVFLGVSWGWVPRTYCRDTYLCEWAIPGGLAVFLFLLQALLVKVHNGVRVPSRVALGSGGLALYACFVMWQDRFAFACDDEDMVICLAFAVVPLFALKPFVRSGAWLTVCGIVLFSATCIACLLHNAPAEHGGSGFHIRWVD